LFQNKTCHEEEEDQISKKYLMGVLLTDSFIYRYYRDIF
jgi:hypothetical protein